MIRAGVPHIPYSPLLTPAAPRTPCACHRLPFIRHHQAGAVNAPPCPRGSIEESSALFCHRDALISYRDAYDYPPHTISVFSFPRTPFTLCPPPKAIIPAAIPSGWSGCRPGEKIHPDRLLINISHKLTQSVRVVRVKSNIMHMRVYARAHAVISDSDSIFALLLKIPGPPGHNN